MFAAVQPCPVIPASRALAWPSLSTLGRILLLEHPFAPSSLPHPPPPPAFGGLLMALGMGLGSVCFDC